MRLLTVLRDTHSISAIDRAVNPFSTKNVKVSSNMRYLGRPRRAQRIVGAITEVASSVNLEVWWISA